jgi:serine/threonine protein kinase
MRVCSVCRRCYEDPDFSCVVEDHPALSDFHPGSPDIIAGFRLEYLLDSNNRGDTYEACHLASGRTCHVRIFTANERLKEQFLGEAQTAKSLFHPNIADVYEAGSLDGGECFVVSEMQDGQSFGELLRADGVPDLLVTIQLVREAAEALHALHLKGLIHRAVNPNNIVITKGVDGARMVKLTGSDLGGVDQHTMVSDKFSIDSALETLKYFAPEQFSNDPASIKTDVYSLGIVFYEMLAGTPPFEAANASGLIEMHKNRRPPEIRIDDFDLRMLVTHTLTESLRKRPEKRQSSANAFARQLRHIEQLATHVSTPPPAISVDSIPRRMPKRIHVTAPIEDLPLVVPRPVEAFILANTIDESVPEEIATQAPHTMPESRMRRRRKKLHKRIHPHIDDTAASQITPKPEVKERLETLLIDEPPSAVPTTTTRVHAIVKWEQPDDIPTMEDLLEVLSSEQAAEIPIMNVTASSEPLISPKDEEIRNYAYAAETEKATPPRKVKQKAPIVEPEKRKPSLKAEQTVSIPAIDDREEITAVGRRIRVPVEGAIPRRKPAFARAAFPQATNDIVFFPTMLGSVGRSERSRESTNGMLSAFYDEQNVSRFAQYRSYIIGSGLVALIAFFLLGNGLFSDNALTASSGEATVSTGSPQAQRTTSDIPAETTPSSKRSTVKYFERPQPANAAPSGTNAKSRTEKADLPTTEKSKPTTAGKTTKSDATSGSRTADGEKTKSKNLAQTQPNKATANTRPRIVRNAKQ